MEEEEEGADDDQLQKEKEENADDDKLQNNVAALAPAAV